jgi:hypothetical protein
VPRLGKVKVLNPAAGSDPFQSPEAHEAAYLLSQRNVTGSRDDFFGNAESVATGSAVTTLTLSPVGVPGSASHAKMDRPSVGRTARDPELGSVLTTRLMQYTSARPWNSTSKSLYTDTGLLL